MFMRFTALFVGLAAASLIVCGGGSTGPRQKEPGRIYVQNVGYVEGGKKFEVFVTVVSVDGQVPGDRDLPQGVQLYQELEIPQGGEPVPVTGVLHGGARVVLRFRVTGGFGYQTREWELPFEVDGNKLIYVTGVNPFEGKLYYEEHSYG